MPFFAAYDWDSSTSDVAILEGLLALNLEREAAQAGSPAAEEEPEDDEELEESEQGVASNGTGPGQEFLHLFYDSKAP